MAAAVPNLDQIVAAAVTEWQQTGQLDVAAWCARYPTVAEQLQPLLRALSTSNTPRPTADRTLAPPSRSGLKMPTFLSPPQGPGELGRLGPYRILGLLGQGGMGTVLRSEDPVLHRPLALKVMPPELANDLEARQRFLREAQATAALDHDHIIGIHQVGEVAGLPFIAMPVLNGETLEARLKRSPALTWTEAVRIAREVASALACAHAAGLIHRDIKPANVFLKAPTGQVKVLDFGLARGVSDNQKLTKSGIMLGTPAYMSPEQARGMDNVDHRCDLFSLGVLLYRMVSGTQPFETKSLMGTLSKLMLFEPPPLGQVGPHVPPALVALTSKLLDKEPANRPPSADWVVQALTQILTGPTVPVNTPAGDVWTSIEDDAPTQPSIPVPVPVASANPPPPTVLAAPRPWGLWMVIAGLGVAVIASVVGVVALLNPSGTLALRGVAARVQVLRAGAVVAEPTAPGDFSLPPGEYTLKVSEADSKLELSTTDITVRGRQRIEVQVLAPPPAVVAPPIPPTVAKPVGPFAGLTIPPTERIPDLPVTALAVLGSSSLRHDDIVLGVAYTANGTQLTSIGRDDRCLVWNSVTGERLATGAPLGGTTCCAFSPNGVQFAASGARAGAMLGATANGGHVLGLTTHPPGAVAMAYNPDNRRLAIVMPKLLLIVDGTTNAVLLSLAAPANPLTTVAWHPKANIVAAGAQDGQVYFWNLDAIQAPKSFQAGTTPINALAYEPTGARLAVARQDGQLDLWDVATAKPTVLLPAGPALTCVAFNVTGTHWAAGGVGPNVRIGVTATGQLERTLIGSAPTVRCLAFSPTGDRLAAGGDDNLIRQWEVATGRALAVPTGHLAPVTSVTARTDNLLLASGDQAGTVLFWDARTGQPERRIVAHTTAVTALAFTPDATFVVSGSADGHVGVWDRYALAPRWRLKVGHEAVRRFAVSGTLLVVGTDGPTRVLDLATGAERRQLPAATALANLPTGYVVVYGDAAGQLHEIEALTGQPLAPLAAALPGPTAPTEKPVPPTAVLSIAVNASGTLVAALTAEGVVRVWDRTTRKVIAVFPLEPQTSATLTFTPTGTLRCWAPQAMRTWNLADELPTYAQAQIIPLTAPACFTSDTGHLLSGHANGTIIVHRWLGK